MVTGGASFGVMLHRPALDWMVALSLGGGFAGAPHVSQILTPIGAIELGRALIRFGELAQRPGGLPHD